ncbi:MAG TPA: DUF433 domain-containing protein [Ktedonobacteraceae bacterium]|jgi:hypothetical protein
MVDNQYISIDPNIAFGKPCIAGTRISVEFILEQLALGSTIDNLLDDYPQLTREQIYASLNFARERIHNEYSQKPAPSLDQIIKQILPVLKQAEVKKAALFGSYVRGDNNENSDVDILVDLPRGKTLLDLVGLKQDLEEILQRKVDVVGYGAIHPLLRDSILASQYPIL